MFDDTPIECKYQGKLHQNEETCRCGRYLQNIQEGTKLLSQRLISVVSKELQQYQALVESGVSSVQENDTLYWNIDPRINEDVKPSRPPIERLLLDMLSDVTTILLDCLES